MGVAALSRYYGLGNIWESQIRLMNYEQPGDLTSAEELSQIRNSNAKLEGWKKLDHCGACEATMASLHVPPTHLRTAQALVKLQEPAISLRVSCLRGKPVDACDSWKPNIPGSNPSCPHFAPLRARTGTAQSELWQRPHSSACIQGSDTVMYQASWLGRPRQQHRQQVLATPQVRHNHPNRSQSSKHPRTRQSTCLPLTSRLE